MPFNRQAVLGGLLLVAVGCGPSALDQLLSTARIGDVKQQRLALRQIADLGPEAAPAIPDLIALTNHADPDVRRLSCLALGNVAAADTLNESTSQRALVIDILSELLESDDRALRTTAAFALLGLDAHHPEAQQCLLSAMQSGDGGIIDRLAHTQPPPTWASETLVQILTRDHRAGIRRLSAVALGQIDPARPQVRKALQQALNDKDDRVRDAAKEALSQTAVTP